MISSRASLLSLLELETGKFIDEKDGDLRIEGWGVHCYRKGKEYRDATQEVQYIRSGGDSYQEVEIGAHGRKVAKLKPQCWLRANGKCTFPSYSPNNKLDIHGK